MPAFKTYLKIKLFWGVWTQYLRTAAACSRYLLTLSFTCISKMVSCTHFGITPKAWKLCYYYYNYVITLFLSMLWAVVFFLSANFLYPTFIINLLAWNWNTCGRRQSEMNFTIVMFEGSGTFEVQSTTVKDKSYRGLSVPCRWMYFLFWY